jgi:hypothetical protein
MKGYMTNNSKIKWSEKSSQFVRHASYHDVLLDKAEVDPSITVEEILLFLHSLPPSYERSGWKIEYFANRPFLCIENWFSIGD